jgi:hypothetical protein
MPDNNETVRIRIKIGQNETEIEGPLGSIRQLIEIIPELTEKVASHRALPESTSIVEQNSQPPPVAQQLGAITTTTLQGHMTPEIVVERTDSLTDVLVKIFRSLWGRQPRRLNEVRDVLQSFGIAYPKQSVAVALLRSAQSGKLRRFKNESGEYVYTGSTALAASDSGNVNLAPLLSQ